MDRKKGEQEREKDSSGTKKQGRRGKTGSKGTGKIT